MWTPRRRFAQRMKQAMSIAKPRNRPFVELCGWSVRSHSSVWCPQSKRARNLRMLFGRRASLLRRWPRKPAAAPRRFVCSGSPHRSSQAICALGEPAAPMADQRLRRLCECVILLSAQVLVLTPPMRHLCRRKPRPSSGWPTAKTRDPAAQIPPLE